MRCTARRRRRGSWLASHRAVVASAATAVVAVVAFVPVFVTFEAPLRVVGVHNPAYLRPGAPALAGGHGGAHRPLRRLRLDAAHAVAGRRRHAVPPGRRGAQDPRRPRGAGRVGAPGSARRILTNLTIPGGPLPTGTAGQLSAVRRAAARLAGGPGRHRRPQPGPGLRLGVPHRGARRGARLRARGLGLEAAVGWTAAAPAATGTSLARCRAFAGAPAARHEPLAMARCVLSAAGRG